jgi:hypothetical protein
MSHIFHGIKLAGNSTADNMHFERLVSDPVPLSYGRVWFNTTDGQFKFSGLDQGGAVTTSVFGSSADLIAAVATLTANLAAEVASRTAGDAAEVTARTAAVTALNAALATEVADRIAAIATESADRITGDATEAAGRTAAIAVAAATAADATSTEAAARLAGDAAANTRIDGAWAELDATQAGAGLNTDGTYTAPLNTTYLDATTSLKTADVALDAAITTEVATRVGQVAGLASGLANETQLRVDGDANLQTQLTAYINAAVNNNTIADQAESARAIAAESALQAELDRTQATIGVDTNGNLIPITGTNYLDAVTTVFGGAFVLDTQVHNANVAIAAEVTARQAADVVLDAALTSEIATRATNDAAIQAELNTTQVGAGLEASGTYVAPTVTNYLAAATSLKDADSILDAGIKAVADRATAIESVTVPNLQAQITAEVNRATAAEAAAGTADAAALAVVTGNLATEVLRATAAESVLTTDLATEVTRALAEESNLQAQISAVVAASGDGAAALKVELNTGRYTYMSVAPALVHTIVHNLNTQFYSANYMVKDSGGIWRNDIAPIEDIDLNSYRITLSVASDVKASGQSNAQLA